MVIDVTSEAIHASDVHARHVANVELVPSGKLTETKVTGKRR
uniref:Conjugative transfer protein TrbI n=1 Tax=Vibrio parahaemolyticus TaxID=670 RepID=A0A1Y1BF10_VIBPH|nr:conjugative transfer protein TrbI [Vibrio parahaemolyticus]